MSATYDDQAPRGTNGATPGRDRIARVLMSVLGIASTFVFVNTALEFGSIAPDRVNVETWRMFGFPVFAGLYFLLAFFPRRMPGVWEMVFYHKAGVAIFLAFFVDSAAGASLADTSSFIILVDVLLAVTTLSCYLLTQGWRAWLPAR